MKKLTQMDSAYARLAVDSGKATDEEVAFLDTMISLQAAHEPVEDHEYSRLQRLTGGYLSPEGPIIGRE